MKSLFMCFPQNVRAYLSCEKMDWFSKTSRLIYIHWKTEYEIGWEVKFYDLMLIKLTKLGNYLNKTQSNPNK